MKLVTSHRTFSARRFLAGLRLAACAPFVACGARSDLSEHDAGSADVPPLHDAQSDKRPCIVAAPATPTLAIGEYHTCFVERDGTVRCWGRNEHGQLGDGTTASRSIGAPVRGLTNVRAIAAGFAHTCALLVNGTVSCWGDNDMGALGLGSITADQLQPVAVPGVADAIGVSAGDDFTCVLFEGGEVSCFGEADSGQLGDGTMDQAVSPMPVLGLSATTSISASQFHVCSVLADGAVACWGNNAAFALGDGTETNRDVPVEVTNVTRVLEVSAGASHSCARFEDGTVSCWGFNQYGQIGDGTKIDRPSPTKAFGIACAQAVSAGLLHTCVLVAGGTIECWGDNSVGALGDGTRTSRATAAVVQGITSAIELGVGAAYHSCAVLQSGSIACWGSNGDGELGDGTTSDSPLPVEVTGL